MELYKKIAQLEERLRFLEQEIEFSRKRIEAFEKFNACRLNYTVEKGWYYERKPFESFTEFAKFNSFIIRRK